MLQLKDITKRYRTGDFLQTALDRITLNFRKSEFVAILGPSGSGKTTCLNIIGGLDRYDRGDLIINGKSTRNFTESDWDAYRNNSIGFVFQNYNLISHLSIIDNVELGMTLSGLPASKRRKKAVEVLTRVGLKDHMKKKPGQLSGGEMQRVAIARALANDPDIILADEPTGALDTQTSIQILELIKETARDKLVIMVTHNPALAQRYADRIIELKDGRVISDSNPYDEPEEKSAYSLKKTRMNFFRYLKPFALAVILCLTLLFLRAVANLTLPNLMSDIVNIGLQQSGIETVLPECISEKGMELIMRFMPEGDQKALDDSYIFIKAGSAEAAPYLKKYPRLADTDAYILKDGIDRKAVEDIYGKAAFAFASIMQGLAETQGKDGSRKDGGKVSLGDADMTSIYELLLVLENLPEGVLDEAITAAERADSSLYRQVGTGLTRLFYHELGVDLHALQFRYIMKTGLHMLLVTLLGAAATIAVSFLSSRTGAGMARNLRRDIFKKVGSFSLEEFDRFSVSTLITRTTNDVTQVQMAFTMGFRMMAYAPIMGIGGIIMALDKSVSLSWIIAVAVIVLIGMITVIFSIAMPRFKLMQKLVDRLNLVTREALSGMMVIRAFGNQGHEEARFEAASGDFRDTSRFISRIMSVLWPSMMLIMNLSSLAIIWAGAHQIQQSALKVGDMMAFIQYAMQIIMSFLFISMMFMMLPRTAVSINRISEVLDTEPAIKDPERPRRLGTCRGEIEFKNVSFRYKGAEADAIHDISFKAKPGQTTAIIGPTGSGKSTLVNLIPRFYDVTKGEITIDGINIKEISQQELRENIGLVPQKAVLFSGVIESNLRYGIEDAPEEELLLAADIAQIRDFIEGSEAGLKTEIAQGGSNVSGGQRQRLAIARALVRKTPIYIFDDSFSALDFRTDAALRKALKTYTESSTVIIVAQRISTVMNADQIIVLDDGRLAGIGTHSELLKTCRAYREIAESQLPKEELA